MRWSAVLVFATLMLVPAAPMAGERAAPPVDDAMADAAQRGDPALLAGVARFEANLGQWRPDVLYGARAPGYNLEVTQQGLRLVASGEQELWFVEGGVQAVEPLVPLQSVSHHFLGDTAVRDVPQFGALRLAGVWPGVDVRIHPTAGLLELDFEVQPGSDPGAIRVAAPGARLTLDEGALLVEGALSFAISAPIAFQDDRRPEVPVAYVVEEGSFSLDVGPYDRSRLLVIDPLLDYGSYLGGTGTDWITAVTARPGDAAGIVYVVGRTTSTNFPLASPTLQSSVNQGVSTTTNDAFIAKVDLDAGAAGLKWSTYLGGASNDWAWDVAATADGIFVVGTTFFTSATGAAPFPTTANAYTSAPNAGGSTTQYSDGFLARISLDGGTLAYSTLFGGSWTDETFGVTAVGPVATVAGVTGWSATVGPVFIPTKNGFQTMHADFGPTGSGNDAFVARFDTAQSGEPSLVWSTLLGGNAADEAYDVAVDGAGDAFVVGRTSATADPQFPVPPTGPDTTANGGDGFLVQVPADGGGGDATLPFGTFIGGTSTDTATGVALYAGEVYVVGETFSANFPTTAGAYQTTKDSSWDVFVSRYDPSSSTLTAATFIGGTTANMGRGIAIDDAGVVIAGHSGSVSGSLDYDVLKAAASLGEGSSTDIIGSRLTHDLDELVWSFKFGGSSLDGGNNEMMHPIVFDNAGREVIAARTLSSGIATSNGYDQTLSGWDGYLMRLAPSAAEAACVPPLQVVRTLPATFDAGTTKEMDYPIVSYEWTVPSTAEGTQVYGPGPDDTVTHTYPAAEVLGPKTVTVKVEDAAGMTSTALCSFLLENAPPVAQFVTVPTAPFTDSPTTLDGSASSDPDGTGPANGLAAFEWTVIPAADVVCNDLFVMQPTCTFLQPGTYTITLKVEDQAGATDTATDDVIVTVEPQPIADFVHSGPVWSCGQGVVVEFEDDSLQANAPIVSYAWDFDDDGQPDASTPILAWTMPAPGIYPVTLKVTDAAGKSSSVTHVVEVAWASPPVASFKEGYGASPYYANQLMLFSSTSQAGSTPIVSHTWDLGDGTNGSGADWEKSYASGGSYEVTLTVADAAGCADSATIPFTLASFIPPPGDDDPVPGPGPKADFAIEGSTVGEVVVFKDQSNPGQAPIAKWSWDLGDGKSASTANTFHRYSDPGTYTITLRVTDSHGRSAVHQATLSVTAPGVTTRATQGPIADAGADLIVVEGAHVVLDGSRSVGVDLAFEWQQIQGPPVALQGAATATPSFTSPRLGPDEAQVALVFSLVVNDGRRASHPDHVIVKVRPEGDLTFLIEDLGRGRFAFHAQGAPEGAELTWSLGDGAIAFGKETSHVYARAGTYTVTLTALTLDGERGATRTLEVGPGHFAAPARQGEAGDGDSFEGRLMLTFLAVAGLVGLLLFLRARKSS